MMAIVELELRNVSNRLKDQDLNFEFTAAAKLFLIEEGYDEKYGARPLRRAIERHLEDSLAEAILGGEIKPGETIHVDVDGDQLSFVQDQHVSGAAGS
jgi:ATP-dependent Clp protease ATP-binding subunit ClpC